MIQAGRSQAASGIDAKGAGDHDSGNASLETSERHSGMTEDHTPSTDHDSGFGCWWLIVIAIVVIFGILVGYLVLA